MAYGSQCTDDARFLQGREAGENGGLSCRETKGFLVHGVDLFADEDPSSFQARSSGGVFGGFGMITCENFDGCARLAQMRDGFA